MQYPSRLLSGVNPETASNARTRLHRDGSGNGPSVDTDLKLAQKIKANLIVIGTEPLVVDLLSLLVADGNPDVMIRCRDGLLRLPPTPRVGTVVFRDVDALLPDEQRRLFEWLDSASNLGQVVSTASLPLLPLVEAGAFSDALYYRLNTVYVELSD